MEQLLSTFGVDWRLLLINAINFGLLLTVLWYFLYGPLTRMLEERRAKIEQGVEDARLAGEKLKAIEAARAVKLAEAGKEADSILSHARTAGSKKELELVERGEAAAARILKEAEAQTTEMKAQALAESREEVAKLVVLGLEKAMQTGNRR